MSCQVATPGSSGYLLLPKGLGLQVRGEVGLPREDGGEEFETLLRTA